MRVEFRGDGSSSSSSSSSSSGGWDQDEHANTCTGATPLAVGGQAVGVIGTPGDVDYFKVEVGASGSLTVYSSGFMDTYGYLKNTSCETTATDDDSGVGSNFSIRMGVAPGTYYVGVRAYSITGTGEFVVHAELQ